MIRGPGRTCGSGRRASRKTHRTGFGGGRANVSDIHLLFDAWAVPLVFLLAFGEFVGFPVAGVPLLVAAGALSHTLGFPWIGMVFVAALGAFLADYLWFRFARADPATVIDIACGLSSNPSACVTDVQRRVTRHGPNYVMIAKLLPRASNLIAPAAGLAAVPGSVFVPRAAAGALLWSVLVMSVGWIFAPWIDAALRQLTAFGLQIGVGMVGLIVLALLWRVHKVRLHASRHVRDGRGR